MVLRQDFINEARNFRKVKFAHQGRNIKTGLDCGGLILVVAQNLHLTEFEFLGYSSFPTNGRFEELLLEQAEFTGWESKYPHNFGGTELKPGDLISFDYRNGEGIRHIAIVTKWDGKRYWVIDATPQYRISEHPLAMPFSKADLKGWRVPGIED